jgi:hypothetical protein
MRVTFYAYPILFDFKTLVILIYIFLGRSKEHPSKSEAPRNSL